MFGPTKGGMNTTLHAANSGPKRPVTVFLTAEQLSAQSTREPFAAPFRLTIGCAAIAAMTHAGSEKH